MTDKTVQAMPELPVVAYINHRACMPPILDIWATPGTLNSEPLCKVSDAITYAESLRSELEAARAVGQKMSNVCFNLSQQEGEALGMEVCQGMKRLCTEWDAALSNHTKEQSNG